ncbi:MAG TPA: hypothetical protein VLH08_06990 [Acidobacteriota bacterium]|nr:hypothetical protein [Acidobacteriota bacterium]
MGLQVKCKAAFNGKISQGNAVLESQDLIFRGEYRIQVPFKAIKRLSEGAGKLSIESDQGTLTLDLGKEAKKWEEKIKNPKSLLDKLGVKDGIKISLRNVDDASFLDELKRKSVPQISNLKEKADMIFFQADSKSELNRVFEVAKTLKQNGSLWIIYPKGQKDLKQDDIFKAGKSAGLVDVKVVSFSSTHTGLKFVIPVSKRN